MEFFGIEYITEPALFKYLTIFDFESICVQEESFINTHKAKRIGKHIPILVSISSNLLSEPFFLCNSSSSSRYLFISALENIALQIKAKMKNLFFDFDTTIQIKMGSVLEKLTQRHNRRKQTDLDDCDNESCTSTQFSQIQKKQLINVQGHLEGYCNVLSIIGSNSAK